MGKGCHFSRYESISGHDRFTIIDVNVFTNFCHLHLDQMHSNLNCIRITYTPAPLLLYTLMFPTVYFLKKKAFVEWRKNVKNLWKLQVHKFKYTTCSLKKYPCCNSKKLLRTKSCLQTDGQSDSNNPSPNFVCGIIALIFLYRWFL